MKCHVCGGEMYSITTDLPFKLESGTIVIFKNLPVMQCGRCSEYAIDDVVMARVDAMSEKVDRAAELEIVRYAA